MKYADYQQIQFNHDKAYWNKLKTPFKLEFYHQGMYFDTPVKLHEITASTVREIKYNPNYFNFGNVQHDPETIKTSVSPDLRCSIRSMPKARMMKSPVSSAPAIFA